jgi:putative transcriptional regulator
MGKCESGLSGEQACSKVLQSACMAETFKSLKGQLLLDNGLLNGSFFHKTVVLICQHDAEGAFGLVLNKSSKSKVGEMLVANLPDPLKEQTLYLGGPVQPNTLSYLHSDTYLPQANVIANLNLGHSLDSLVELGEEFSATKQIRLFAGYSGWGAGQLEDEMRRKAWVTHPASLDLVLQREPEKLWRQILLQKGWQFRLLAETPDDLTWN